MGWKSSALSRKEDSISTLKGKKKKWIQTIERKTIINRRPDWTLHDKVAKRVLQSSERKDKKAIQEKRKRDKIKDRTRTDFIRTKLQRGSYRGQ